MGYVIPKSQASQKQNRIEFKFDGETKWRTLPLLKFVKPALVEELAELQGTASIKRLLEHYHPGIYSEFDDLEQLTGLYEYWAEESGISMGESSASTDS